MNRFLLGSLLLGLLVLSRSVGLATARVSSQQSELENLCTLLPDGPEREFTAYSLGGADRRIFCRALYGPFQQDSASTMVTIYTPDELVDRNVTEEMQLATDNAGEGIIEESGLGDRGYLITKPDPNVHHEGGTRYEQIFYRGRYFVHVQSDSFFGGTAERVDLLARQIDATLEEIIPPKEPEIPIEATLTSAELEHAFLQALSGLSESERGSVRELVWGIQDPKSVFAAREGRRRAQEEFLGKDVDPETVKGRRREILEVVTITGYLSELKGSSELKGLGGEFLYPSLRAAGPIIGPLASRARTDDEALIALNRFFVLLAGQDARMILKWAREQ